MRCDGELRRAKGALIFIPEGTENYLRVEWTSELPDDFKTGKARAILVSEAQMVRDGAKMEDRLSPGDGIPEEICGKVLQTISANEVVVNVGFPLHILLPEGKNAGDRLFATLADSLVAREAEIL
jgi:hypothetical protein